MQEISQELFIFFHKLLDFLGIQLFVAKSTSLAFFANSGGVDPLAGELLCLVAVLAVLLSSLTVVLHEIFAQLKF